MKLVNITLTVSDTSARLKKLLQVHKDISIPCQGLRNLYKKLINCDRSVIVLYYTRITTKLFSILINFSSYICDRVWVIERKAYRNSVVNANSYAIIYILNLISDVTLNRFGSTKILDAITVHMYTSRSLYSS